MDRISDDNRIASRRAGATRSLGIRRMYRRFPARSRRFVESWLSRAWQDAGLDDGRRAGLIPTPLSGHDIRGGLLGLRRKETSPWAM